LLLDRLNTVGALPGRPLVDRALQTALLADTLRVDDFVDVLVKNPALVWELLRAVNVASIRNNSADEGVTMLSRAVMLLGQQGMRRVAGSVRAWPGALGAQASRSDVDGNLAIKELNAALRLSCLAGHIARLMSPFSIHDEEASITAMSQRLGWLLTLYHFPDEAAQIRKLMLAGPPAEAGGPTTPGMALEAAASAVLGINLDDLSAAVMKHWGLHERLIQAARPLARNTPVRHPSSIDETLRTVASLANELADTIALEPAKAVPAVHQVFLRYARALELGAKECNETIERAIRLVDAPLPGEPAASGAAGVNPA
jgi:HD-like signal output (HDOD) protein